jgi:ubiquitin-protein ligase
MHRIYFLLSGTKDTPYSHGLYLFEVLLPENYPNSPPKVKIVTTGNGSINFNPNLYNCGHICLSIINTWAGRPEEQWNPESSTLLQVMLSIQSLVMDNNIIHKEPGFDKYPSNCPENLTYQYEVKYGNIKYAMIKNIKKPPLGFDEVVRNHFKCKKEEILNTVYNWTKEMQSVHNIGFTLQNQNINAEINIIGPYQAFSDLYSELYTLLDKL